MAGRLRRSTAGERLSEPREGPSEATTRLPNIQVASRPTEDFGKRCGGTGARRLPAPVRGQLGHR